METSGLAERNRLRQLDRSALESMQLNKLNELVSAILPTNAFYQDRLADIELPLTSLDQLRDLPITTKSELVATNSEFATNRTFELSEYNRFHRTSGTQGKPLIVLDTADDWQWWIQTWQFVLDAAELDSTDRVAMAFSFGPFIGFWSANDALADRGCMVVPCGGMDTLSRLNVIETIEATAVCCTPTYALRMAQVAAENNIDLASNHVRCLIVAGEPGGSIPEIRDRIEKAWGAIVIDHTGATEVGPWGFADNGRKGIHVIESEFIAECFAVDSEQPAQEGQLSELVLTNLGRTGSPVLRYKTGDLVRPYWNHQNGCRFVFFEGGVLGRSDDMMIIRGVNIFPSSLETILRSFDEVVEFRLTATKRGEMDALKIEVETTSDVSARIEQEFRTRLGLSVDVIRLEANSLPRFEAKGKRFIDQR